MCDVEQEECYVEWRCMSGKKSLFRWNILEKCLFVFWVG